MGSAPSLLDPLSRLQTSSGGEDAERKFVWFKWRFQLPSLTLSVPKKDIKALYERQFPAAGSSIDLRRLIPLRTLFAHPKVALNVVAQLCFRSHAAGESIRFEEFIHVLGKLSPNVLPQAKLSCE
jgi:hypothetical protein